MVEPEGEVVLHVRVVDVGKFLAPGEFGVDGREVGVREQFAVAGFVVPGLFELEPALEKLVVHAAAAAAVVVAADKLRSEPEAVVEAVSDVDRVENTVDFVPVLAF